MEDLRGIPQVLKWIADSGLVVQMVLEVRA